MASDPTWHGQRPVRLGGQRRAVRAPERVAVPVEGPARHREPCLRQGIQRGEGSRSAVDSPRTDEQTAVALFYVVNPIELFNRTFRVIAEDRGLSLVEEARLFAMLNIATADTSDQLLERQGGVRLLASDHRHPRRRQRRQPQHRRRHRMGAVFPPSGTPPYPDHPSGYNCVSGAMMHTAKAFFGTDRMTFSVVRTSRPSRT